MKLSMISSLALAGAMMLSTSAFAQDAAAPAADMAAPTMIGQQALSAEDLPYVQAQCNTLAGVEKSESTANSDSSPDSSSGGDSNQTDSAETPDGTSEALAKIDLDLITIEECKAAGLAM